MTIINRIDLRKHGICLFVGSLEATILTALWDHDTPVTMARFYRYLIERRLTEKSYSTIITTLNRLAQKNLIIRTPQDNSVPLWSSAFESQDHFIEVAMIDTLNVLYNNYGDHVIGYIGA